MSDPKLPKVQERLAALEAKMDSLAREKAQRPLPRQELNGEIADEPGEHWEDIRVLGMIGTELLRLTDIFKNLANAGERIQSDLKLARGAAVRLNRGIRRLIDRTEGG